MDLDVCLRCSKTTPTCQQINNWPPDQGKANNSPAPMIATSTVSVIFELFFTDPVQGLQKRKRASCYRECKRKWVEKKGAALSLVITSTEDTECLQVPNSPMQAKSHWKLLASAQKRSSMTRIARFFRSHELPLRPARPASLSSECSCSHWSILAGGNGLFETRYVGGLGTKTNPQHRTLKIPAPIQPK